MFGVPDDINLAVVGRVGLEHLFQMPGGGLNLGRRRHIQRKELLFPGNQTETKAHKPPGLPNPRDARRSGNGIVTAM
jgi:hypothetical protein